MPHTTLPRLYVRAVQCQCFNYVLHFLRVTVYCCKFYSFKETCCRFWPDKTTKSMEFSHIKVNHDSTIPITGYEVTRLDVFEKGMVSLQ